VRTNLTVMEFVNMAHRVIVLPLSPHAYIYISVDDKTSFKYRRLRIVMTLKCIDLCLL
jgi:hypothetical protein